MHIFDRGVERFDLHSHIYRMSNLFLYNIYRVTTYFVKRDITNLVRVVYNELRINYKHLRGRVSVNIPFDLKG